MISLRSLAYQPWHRLLSVLLALIMVVTPLVSTMAQLHESEHLTAIGAHSNTHADRDIHANQDQDNDNNTDTDESSLHFLAHASHCCGHIVALLPHIQYLVLAPIQSALNIKREHSRKLFLRISHFRPPIFL